MRLVIEKESDRAVILKIELDGQPAVPSDLRSLVFPDIDGYKGVIVSGFPQWVPYAVGQYYKNKVKWTALFDPKVGENVPSAIVGWSVGEYQMGDVIPLSLADSSSPAEAAAN